MLLAVQVHLTCGLVYSIDDPYIHLALAKQILRGHYGLNAGEFAAPSSSILWPFLLAPLAFTRLVEFLPLVLNIAALLVAVWWIGRWLESHMPSLPALLATTAVAFALNFYGLALTGMEHSLQVTLTVIVGLSLVRGRIAWPFWLSVVLLPLVRYEGLAISLPALAFLFLSGGPRVKTVAAGAVIAVVVGGFSLFLYKAGGGWLPSSVLAKTDLQGGGLWENLEDQWVFAGFALLAAGLLLREGRAFAAVLLVVVPTVLHLVFGKYGWFGRYHIYIDAWILVFLFDAYARSRFAASRPVALVLTLAFAWASMTNVICTLTTALGARNIADQQRQMGLILRDHLDEPVAAHDIGFVSLYARRYVLDLAGLGSREVLKHRADPATDVWVKALMDRHKVEHAMVYDSWVPRRPANWIRVATLHLPAPQVTVGSSEVAFYSTSPEAAARLRRALTDYRKTSPQAALMLALTDPR